MVASGHPKTVTGDMIKPGATVIDVGVNRVPDASAAKGYRLVGDYVLTGTDALDGKMFPDRISPIEVLIKSAKASFSHTPKHLPNIVTLHKNKLNVVL